MSHIIAASSATLTRPKLNMRLISAIMIGNVLEWYDFIVYASLAPILSVVFFPQEDQFIAIVLTFAIFAVGFITRPLGGIFFGHLGDRYGRRKALVFSVLMMAIPALSIAALPTYDQIGRMAPIILLVCRLLQGFAMGGECPVVMTYVGELAPPEKRGYIGSYIIVTNTLGILLAIIVVTFLTQILSEADMHNWGWRVPFFCTLLSVLFGYYLRRNLLETNVFGQVKQTNAVHKNPLIEALKTKKLLMLKIFMFFLGGSVLYHTYTVFIITYLKQTLGMSYLEALYVSIAGSCFLIASVLLAGKLSDKIGRRSVMLVGITSLILFSYPLYTFYTNASMSHLLLVQLGFALMIGCVLGPFPALTVEQVNTSVRCSSIALGYNLGIVFGGMAPMIHMLLINHFKTHTAPSFYLIFTMVLAFVAVFSMRDKVGEALE